MKSILEDSEFIEEEYSKINQTTNESIMSLPRTYKAKGNESFNLEKYEDALTNYRMALLAISEIFNRNLINIDNQAFDLVKNIQVFLTRYLAIQIFQLLILKSVNIIRQFFIHQK